MPLYRVVKFDAGSHRPFITVHLMDGRILPDTSYPFCEVLATSAFQALVVCAKNVA